jgi:catechol 2,3-dioxygenase-like lactoylglutathione lyase family enzyme
MKFDHVAINVADIARSIAWYKERVGAEVLYQDDTWGFIRVVGVKLALTLKDQHPAHLAFDVGPNPTEEFFKGAKTHRDGSISKYVNDPDGNPVEWIHYPDSTH